MASNISNMLNNKLRISGMASGLDTDTMIKQLMAAERVKVDRVKQGKELVEWKRDNYREVTNALRSFQDEFFNVLKPASNMRSQNTYNIYNSNSTNSTIATATGGAGVTSTSHTIEVIELAKSASGSSTGTVTKGVSGSTVNSFNIDGYNNTFTVNYNGVTKDIVIPNGSYADASGILGSGIDGKLKQLVQQAFNGNVVVSEVGGKLQFSTSNATDILTVTTKSMPGDNLLGTLGVNSNGVGTLLNFGSPMEIKKGMKFEIPTITGGTPSTNVIQWDVDKTYNDIGALAADIQSRIDASFGVPGKVLVTATAGALKFDIGAGVDSFSLSNSDIVKNLGLQSGDSNKLNLNDNMEKLSTRLVNGDIIFDVNGKFTLTINNTNIEVNKTDTLNTFISKVNNSSAGVNLSYSAYTDTFSISSKETGAGNIDINDNGSGFFSKINLNITAGQDASFKLDGMAGTRRTNTFGIDGVTYNLAAKGTTDITLTQNTDGIFDKIKAFVEKYNEVINKISNELIEKHERSYTPLTDEQKESMKEDDIKRWEEKAKAGLLRNDSMLNSMITNMRLAVSDAITDVAGGLPSIGISSGSYLDKGKLTIDESKLKDAIKNNPDKVMSIFNKESSIAYKDVINGVASRADRYKQSGIINRLYDILQDNIRIIRDKDGKKGFLLEKAGIAGDLSEFKNVMNDDMDNKNKLIDTLTKKLFDKEDAYYRKFAALEKAMSQMNSQSSWISQQFGGGQ